MLRRFFHITIAITALSLAWISGLYAQESGSYYPISSRQYSLTDGLPDKCSSAAFQQTDGRLIVITCRYVQRAQNLHMYQFDGFRTYRRDFDFGDINIATITPTGRTQVLVSHDLLGILELPVSLISSDIGEIQLRGKGNVLELAVIQRHSSETPATPPPPRS